jgi:hypothetical protein
MKTKQNLALLMNLVSGALQIYALVIAFTTRGFSPLQYYTIDSNILGCISSLILVGALLIKGKTPSWVHKLRYYATSCLAVTMAVVVFIIIPGAGFRTIPELLFQGTNLWMHTVCPLLSIVSFLIFEKESKLDVNQSIYALVPTFVYGIITLILNIIRVIRGPYSFMFIYEQSIWMTFLWMMIIGGIAYILAEILRQGNLKIGLSPKPLKSKKV